MPMLLSAPAGIIVPDGASCARSTRYCPAKTSFELRQSRWGRCERRPSGHLQALERPPSRARCA
jgi:hypothetical protein